MSLEIERKFLVIDNTYRLVAKEVHIIEQGYISREPDSTVRVRIYDDQGFITVKTRNHGAVRNEWEWEIPLEEAREMLVAVCQGHVLSKKRFIVDAGDGLRWEIDEFDGKLTGLVVAEIEIPTEDTPFLLPKFIGEEVTGDPKYYNSALVAQV